MPNSSVADSVIPNSSVADSVMPNSAASNFGTDHSILKIQKTSECSHLRDYKTALIIVARSGDWERMRTLYMFGYSMVQPLPAPLAPKVENKQNLMKYKDQTGLQ